MAICHVAVKSVSRATSRSAPGAAAYRSGTAITCERDGSLHDYTRRRGVEATFILAPDGAAWAQDRSALWNAAEAAENRRDAKVAREYELALPHELDAAARRELAESFARTVVERFGVAVDVAVHSPHRDGDDRNHHVHVLATTRVVEAGGLGAKTRELDSPRTSGPLVEELREAWAAQVNAALERAASAARVDHRSYARQGDGRQAGQHMGPGATALERSGVQTRIGDINEAAAQHNAALGPTLAEQRAALTRDIGRAQRRERSEGRMAAARAELGLGREAHGRASRPITPTRPEAQAAPARAPTPRRVTAPPQKVRRGPDLRRAWSPGPTPPTIAPISAPPPAIVEAAIVPMRETPAERTAQQIAEGEAWLAAERAAGRIPAAAQAEAAPAAPTTPSPQPPEPARAAAPRATEAPAGEVGRLRTMPGGLMDRLAAGGRAATGAAVSAVRQVAGLFAAGPATPEAPAPVRQAPQPAAPTAAPEKPRRTDFGHLVQAVTRADPRGDVRFYTTETEQQADDGGIKGLEGALRRGGAKFERRPLFKDTNAAGQERSWIALICNQYSLGVTVTQMGEAGEELVNRLDRATKASAARFTAHIQPWLERMKTAAAAKRATDKAARKGAGKKGTGRGDDDTPGIA